MSAARKRKAQQTLTDPDAAAKSRHLFQLAALDAWRQAVTPDEEVHALRAVIGVLCSDAATAAERPPAPPAAPRGRPARRDPEARQHQHHDQTRATGQRRG